MLSLGSDLQLAFRLTAKNFRLHGCGHRPCSRSASAPPPRSSPIDRPEAKFGPLGLP